MNRLCVYPRLRFLHSHPGYLGAAVRHVAREGEKRYNANRRRAGIHIMRSELDLDSGRPADPAAGARKANSGIVRTSASDRCLAHIPCRPVEADIGQQEDDLPQVHNRSVGGMVGHHRFGRLVLEVAGHRPARLEDRHEQHVPARRRLSGRRPPPSFVPSTPCESP